ncbi:hypothetical protein MHU86_1451 [Fragilaria crotonensis]|nr:hypothetical protein MHU86_1451 [Fragilaria crotonensis]
MPLASSASKERLSLPATIDSTTKVTRPKAIRRRHSLRSKRDSSPAPVGKENDNENKHHARATKHAPTRPGPTPYYLVAAERESKGEHPYSPRLTRSAQKKKPLLPPFGQTIERTSSRGIAMSFSPPDQEANRRRESEELARKKADFEQRVKRAKASGRYLAFSPTSGRPLQSFDDDEDAGKDYELARLVGGQQEAIQNLEGQMNQFLIMQTKSFDEGNKSEQLAGFQATNAHLTDVNARLEETIERIEREKLDLQDQVGEMKGRLLVETTKHETEITVAKNESRAILAEKEMLNAKFEEAKEQYLIERTRMEAELDSLKRESDIRLEGLGESRKGLEEEKQKLYARVEELEIKLLHSKDQYTDMKATQSKLSSDKEHLIDAKNRLESDLEKIASEKLSLQQQVSGLKHELHLIQTKVLPDGEARYDAVVNELEMQKEATNSVEVKWNDSVRQLDDMKRKMNDLEKEKEEERVNFQKLNEDSAKAFGKLERESAEKNALIDELKKEMDVLAADLEVEQQNRQALAQELKLQGDEANKAIDDLEAQADDLAAEVEREKGLRAELNTKLQKKEADMTEAVQELQAQVISLKDEVEGERIRCQRAQDSLKESNTNWETSFAEVKAETERLAAEVEDGECLRKQLEEQLKQNRIDMREAVEELQAQIETFEDKLSLADADKTLLEEKLVVASSCIEELTVAKQEALCQKSDVKKCLSDNEKKIEQMVQTIASLRDSLSKTQLQLKETQAKLTSSRLECNDAHSRLVTFDDREEELFRKLRESDRIRRDLHAKVMQLSGNIRVFVRVRPELPGEKEKELKLLDVDHSNNARKRKHAAIEDAPFKFPGMFDCNGNPEAEDLCKNLVEVTEPPKDRGGLKERKRKWRFGFDNVFPPSQGQEEIWEATEPLVQSAIDGYNVCIFAYGQTGSGKTYTMLGDQSNKGIVSRAVEKLFESKLEIETLSKGRTLVSISVELLEIYNEKVRDLLSTSTIEDQNLKVKSSDVEGNVLATTSSTEEVMQILEIAQSRRCVKSTNSNA